jgi:hypothetical protein
MSEYTPSHDPWEDGVHDVDADVLNNFESGISTAIDAANTAQETADAAASQQLPFVRNDEFEQKGDLLAGQSSGVPSRLAVGSADQTIFPDTSTATGVAWGAITGARISGYPSDSSKFLRGDGAWAAPSGGIGPTHIGFTVSGSNYSTTANTATLVPIPNIISSTTITRIGFRVATAAGNYDVGVYYSDNDITFTRLVSLGSTAVPSAGARVATIASSTLTPVAGRRWYLALAVNNAGSIWAGSAAIPGAFFQASSFPLPASLSGTSAIVTEGVPSLTGMV